MPRVTPGAVVIGEALMDLFEDECDGAAVYRPVVGGGPLNVAVGLARLGSGAEFVGSLGRDVLGERIRTFLREAGVGTAGCVDVAVPTTIALTSLRDGQPEFHFYGAPPSYGLLGPDDLDLDLIARARGLYCGFISLLCPGSLAAARAAWRVPGPLRALDPNIRPSLVDSPEDLRGVIDEFAASADVVKLSDADASNLYGLAPEPAARRLRAAGARAVVVTMGGAGALLAVGGDVVRIPAPPVRVVDTTGAGDATMAGLLHALLTHATPPDSVEGWLPLVRFAVAVGSVACETRGGATSMPTLSAMKGHHRIA